MHVIMRGCSINCPSPIQKGNYVDLNYSDSKIYNALVMRSKLPIIRIRTANHFVSFM
jgi:hypothetical protein